MSLVLSCEQKMRRHILALMAFVMILLTSRSYTLYLAALGQSLGFQNVEIGFLSFVRMVTQVVLLVPAGILIDVSRNKYRLLQIAIFCIALTSLLAGFVQSFILHVVLSMLFAMGLVLLQPAMISLVTARVKVSSAVSRVSIFSSAFTLGIGLGAITGASLSTIFFLPSVYQLLGGVGFIGIAFVEIAQRRNMIPARDTPEPIKIPFRERLRDEFSLVYRTARGGLQAVYISEGIRQMAFYGFYVFLSIYVFEIGGDITLAGYADSLNSGISFISILLLGRLLKPKHARISFIFGVGCHVVLLIGFLLITTPVQILLLMAFAGLAWAATQIGTLSLLTLQTQDKERGRQNGVLTAAKTSGSAIGAPIVGGLSDASGDFISGILFSTAIASFAAFYAAVKVKSPKLIE